MNEVQFTDEQKDFIVEQLRIRQDYRCPSDVATQETLDEYQEFKGKVREVINAINISKLA